MRYRPGPPQSRWKYLPSALSLMLSGASLVALPGTSQAVELSSPPEQPAALTIPCPGRQCPFTSPTSNEEGAATDILARINLERSAPQRNYVLDGAPTSLPHLAV